jgi:hypothetical protein
MCLGPVVVIGAGIVVPGKDVERRSGGHVLFLLKTRSGSGDAIALRGVENRWKRELREETWQGLTS